MNKLPKFLTGVLPAAALVLMTAAAGAQSVNLKSQFKPGSICYVETDQQIDQKLSGGQFGEGMVVRVHQIMGVDQKVEGGADGAVKVLLTYARILQSIESPMMPKAVAFDSDGPKESRNEMLADIFDPMLGKTMTMTVDQGGKITSFSGMKPILAQLEEHAAGNILYEQMKHGLDDDTMRHSWGTSRMLYFPNKEVKVGDTWKSTVTQPSPLTGDLEQEYNCKFERVVEEDGRKLAVVSYTALTRVAKGARPAAGTDVDIQFASGAGKGTVWLDVAAGELARLEEDSESKLVMGGGPGADASTPKIDVTVKMRQQTNVLTPAQREKQKAENARKAAEAAKATEAGKSAEKKPAPDAPAAKP